ncbi:AfsR/SARP family transcriptional regulator [Kitasatospora sp. RB6PN24]|uniref:AfsR/SARP family transcriptional regulator n=1 Tax=Kitasatospora humi TaxID=2893891 RepID=UPI001E3BB149|nr:AfsR/SARP family transcriptional regulator [Kitasatospora humi]MCC9311467.1 AfsR/SARP family transcriptional regulator [Kitasatospora humi]
MEIEGGAGPGVSHTPKAAKLRALLGTLLVRANQVVSVESLVTELWQDEPPRTATSTLHVYVSQLRKLLATVDPARGRELLRTQPPGYRLALAPDLLDLSVFEGLHRLGREALADGRYHDAADLQSRAVALLRGPLLSDTPHGPLLEGAAAQLAEAGAAALDQRIRADLQLGRHHELIAELRSLATQHPLREELHGHLMLALYRAGRQAEALQAFAALRKLLVAELAVEPGPPLQRLHRRILAGDPGLLLPATGQGGSAAARNGAGGTASPGAPAGAALPPADPVFTGRDTALARVEELLRQAPAGSFVAVTGQPGVGKTAFALEAAHRSGPAFPDGRLFLDLQPEPGHPLPATKAISTLLRRRGVRLAHGAGAGELRDAWQQQLMGRQLLLVLDNADSEAQLRPLLPTTAGSSAIVTTRRLPAGFGGIRPVLLDALDPEEARLLFAAAAGPERAAAEPAAVRELLELCGRLPLAIRVVAAQLTARPHWSAASLVDRLRDERFRLGDLHIGELDARTPLLRAYRDARPELRRAFRLLGLLPAGPFGRAAAGAVLGLPPAETARLLDGLIEDRLLVDADRAGHQVPELLRVLAVERLDEEESPQDIGDAIERLCEEYARTAEQVSAVLTGARPGGEEPPEPAGWFTRERDALVGAVRQAHRAGRLTAAVRLVAALDGHLETHAAWDAWAETHALALDAARRCGDRGAEVRTLRSLGDLAWQQRRLEEAEEHYGLARRIAEETGQRAELSRALVGLAELRMDTGDGAAVEALLTAALAAAPDPAAPRARFDVLRALGFHALAAGDRTRAGTRFTACLDLARTLRDRRLESFARRALRTARSGPGHRLEVRPGVWRLPGPGRSPGRPFSRA